MLDMRAMMYGFRTSIKFSDLDTQRTQYLNKTKYLCQYSFTVLFLVILLEVPVQVLVTLWTIYSSIVKCCNT